jgi:hypothetical protein
LETDPPALPPYTRPQAKAGSVIKGGEKNFLLKSLGSLFAKRDQRFCAANLTRRIVWQGFCVNYSDDFRKPRSAVSVERVEKRKHQPEWQCASQPTQRGNTMKNRCKDFGELSPTNRLAGCVNIDINWAAFQPTHVRKGNGTGINQKRKRPLKAKSSRFDILVARYYPAVYSLASRLTDDPREAIALTRNAFRSAQKELCSLRDQTAVATSLILAVIRAALAAG